MKILFTGSTSFTGMWFIKALSEAGHKVTSILLKPKHSYTLLKKERMNIVMQYSEKIIEECPFGSEKFLEIAEKENWDVLCHHASEVTNYKDDRFDYIDAVNKNTKNLENLLKVLNKVGCKKIVLTGTVFEQREGQGDDLSAVSPYGLSKGITSDIFSFLSAKNEIALKKFVIANPFGPYEEERFTTYLIKKWAKKERAIISYPRYIRDNIPVTLLSKIYQLFVEDRLNGLKITPSYYVETMKEFTNRFSKEISSRLLLKCEFDVVEQSHYKEPMIRHGIERNENIIWNEKSFWDTLAEYYQKFYL